MEIKGVRVATSPSRITPRLGRHRRNPLSAWRWLHDSGRGEGSPIVLMNGNAVRGRLKHQRGAELLLRSLIFDRPAFDYSERPYAIQSI
jgi:hypothetical protein